MRKDTPLLILLTLLSFITLVGVSAVATNTAKVYVDPSIAFGLVDESLTVDIKVADVINLYSWQVRMSFDSDVLQCVNVTEGEFLKDQPEGTVRQVNIQQNWALFGWSTRGEHVGQDGSGTLATVEFLILAEGESIINITSPYSFLLKLNPPPVPPGGEVTEDIPRTLENGYFNNAEVPPTPKFTYSPSELVVNETITFDASNSSAESPRNITRYEWDFGDQTTANETDPITTHTYTQAGTYNVTLTVFDDAEMPRAWYEIYSTLEKELEFLFAHDIAILEVDPSPTEVAVGETVTIEVTISNKGTESETFDVTTYYDDNEIDTQTGVTLAGGANTTLTFTWDTTGVDPEDYTISAEASVVSGETETDNNEFTDGTVTVTSGEEFPMMLIVAAIVVIVVLGLGVFLYMRRKGA